MKVAISAGHGFGGDTSGTSQSAFKVSNNNLYTHYTGSQYNYFIEKEQNRILKNEIINLLRSGGIDVVDCTVDDPSSQSDRTRRTAELANNSGADVFLELHFDASNLNAGTLAIVPQSDSSRSITAAKLFTNKVSTLLGVGDRGYNQQDNYVINHTSNIPIRVLLEVCCSGTSDLTKYFNAGVSTVAKTIADTISNDFNDIPTSGKSTSTITLAESLAQIAEKEVTNQEPKAKTGEKYGLTSGWCAAFVLWCARQAGFTISASDSSITSSANYPKTLVAAAVYYQFANSNLSGWCIPRSQLSSTVLQRGDIVVYTKGGAVNSSTGGHIEVVIQGQSEANGSFTTAMGNSLCTATRSSATKADEEGRYMCGAIRPEGTTTISGYTYDSDVYASNVYASAVILHDSTIPEIQELLDKAYSSAPDVIKNRASRLKSVIDNCNECIKKTSQSLYIDSKFQ